MKHRNYDVVVVGARCAGAATAMLLARRGLRVLVVDRTRYGTDTLSTLALMRGGVLQLARWGLLGRVRASGAAAVETTTFHYGDDAIAVPIKPRDGIDALYAPRRMVLDAILADAAEASGAELAFGLRAVDLLRSADGERVSGVVVQNHDGERYEVHAGLVIGADGRNSTVSRLVGAERTREGRHATGSVYGFWSGLPLSGFHWYFRPGVSAGVIPTNDGQSLVFAAVPSERFRNETRHDVAAGYDRVLQEVAPRLATALRDATREGPLRGFPGLPGYMRACQGPGWALVGDAGYFKDPLTAHGITDAFRDAELLARAVACGSDRALENYEAERDALSRGLFDVTDAIASFTWDLEEVQRLHMTLSQEMNRDVQALLSIDSAGHEHDLIERDRVAQPV